MSQYYQYDPLTSGITSNNNELYYESQVNIPSDYNNTNNNNITILNQFENINDNNLLSDKNYKNQTISYDNVEYNNLLNNDEFNTNSNYNYIFDSSNYGTINDYSSKSYHNINSYITSPNDSDQIYYQTKNEEITIPQNFTYDNNYDNLNNLGTISNNSIHTQHEIIKPIYNHVSQPKLDFSHNTNSFHGIKTINNDNTINYHTNKAIQVPNNIFTQNDYSYNNNEFDNYPIDLNSLDNIINSTTNNLENYGQDEIILNYDNNSVENNYFNPSQNYLNDINYNSNTFQNYIIQNNSSVNDISGLKLDIPKPIVIQRRKLEESDFKNIIYTDIGMINLGNTCYINSCLQVLIHCPNFIDKFFEKFKTLKKEEKEEALISKHFYDICYTIVDTVNTQEKYIDISNFKNEFGKKHPIYGGYNPNDSQEFCRFFLEDLSSELNEIKTKVLYREYTENDQKSKKEQDEDFDYKFKQREKSIITDIFYSQIITSFTCECKSINYSFQKILDFPLLLPENDQTVDIIDLLKSYFQPETIDYEKKCEKCQKVIKRKKEIKISRPPEILILSLQRIDQKTQNKNECVVTFPQNLDMKDFIDSECGFDKDSNYNLYAVINHTGTIDFGHYYSDILFHQKEEWFEFNDSSVVNIGKTIESFPYAYILFYVRNQNKKKKNK